MQPENWGLDGKSILICSFLPGETRVLADIRDQGEITQISLTPTGVWRGQIIRFYWDGEETLGCVECLLGDARLRLE